MCNFSSRLNLKPCAPGVLNVVVIARASEENQENIVAPGTDSAGTEQCVQVLPAGTLLTCFVSVFVSSAFHFAAEIIHCRVLCTEYVLGI